MTYHNGLWPSKDSLTVPLYCQADLALIVSLEKSTILSKCFLTFSIIHLQLDFIHIWTIQGICLLFTVIQNPFFIF